MIQPFGGHAIQDPLFSFFENYLYFIFCRSPSGIGKNCFGFLWLKREAMFTGFMIDLQLSICVFRVDHGYLVFFVLLLNLPCLAFVVVSLCSCCLFRKSSVTFTITFYKFLRLQVKAKSKAYFTTAWLKLIRHFFIRLHFLITLNEAIGITIPTTLPVTRVRCLLHFFVVLFLEKFWQ